MEIKLSEHAIERSAYGIQVSLLDSAGDAVAPKTLAWSLTDQAGVVINGRKDVAVESPGASEVIVLTGDDLQIITSGSRYEARKIIVSGTYDDVVLGDDAPFRGEIQFVVDNLPEPALPT